MPNAKSPDRIHPIHGIGSDSIPFQCANEVGNGDEVWRGAARERNEGDVFAAGTLDVAAADDALAVSEQNDLEQHRGWVRGSTCGIVAEPGIQTRQVDLVIEQIIQCVFNSAG